MRFFLQSELDRRGLSQTEFAALLGVHPSMVNLWCRGRRRVPEPRVREALAACDAGGGRLSAAHRKARRLMRRAGRLLRTT